MTIRSIALLLALGACVRSRPTPDPGYWVASDSSLYTPVVRFRAHVDVRRDRVLVNIDSGTVSVPGEPMRDALPLMSNLYLSAIVAVPDSNSFTVVGSSSRRRYAERRAWSPLAQSDSVLLLRELGFGERASAPALQLSIPGSFAADARSLWLIFRISGNTVELSAPAHPGGPIRRRDLPGAVRVYACGERDLAGRLNAERARALKRAYGLAC